MEDADLPAVVDVWERSRWDSRPWLEERMGYSHEDNFRAFRDLIAPRCRTWLACQGQRVIGLLALNEDFVDQLYVDPEWQSRGVGSRLLDHAKAESPGGLALFTLQRNEGARRFYEARGFRAVAFGVSPAPENEPDVRYEWSPGSE